MAVKIKNDYNLNIKLVEENSAAASSAVEGRDTENLPKYPKMLLECQIRFKITRKGCKLLLNGHQTILNFLSPLICKNLDICLPSWKLEKVTFFQTDNMTIFKFEALFDDADRVEEHILHYGLLAWELQIENISYRNIRDRIDSSTSIYVCFHIERVTDYTC